MPKPNDELLAQLLGIQKRRWSKRFTKAQVVKFAVLLTGIVGFVAALSQIIGITIAGTFGSTSPKDAVRLDYRYNCINNVGFTDAITNKRYGGILFSDDDIVDFKRYVQANKPTVSFKSDKYCISPVISIDINNVANEEHVKVAPFLIIKILETSTITNGMKLNFLEGYGGGSGMQYHYASGTLTPFQQKNSAAYIIPDSLLLEKKHQGRVDFLNIQPKDNESILLSIRTYPGYNYRFLIGVYYSFKGERYIKWLGNEFNANSSTNEVRLVTLDGGLKDVKNLLVANENTRSEYEEVIYSAENALQKEPFFTFDRDS